MQCQYQLFLYKIHAFSYIRDGWFFPTSLIPYHFNQIIPYPDFFTTSLIPYLENFIHLFHGCWIFCIRDDSFSTSLIPYFLWFWYAFIKNETFYAGFHVFYKEWWISNYFHPLCSKLYWLYPLYWKMVSCNPSLNLRVFNQLHPLFFPKFQLVVPYIASLICENACMLSRRR